MMESNFVNEEVNHGLKLLAKSSMIVFVGLFFSKVFTYVYRIVIARHFGPEIYGVFSLATMILGLLVALSSLGLVEGLLRYIPWYIAREKKKEALYLIRLSFCVTLFFGIFSGGILFLSSEYISINLFHSPDLILFFKIFSLIIPFYILANLFLTVIQAYGKIGWYSFILNILQNLVKTLFLILFIYLGVSESSIIFSYSLGIMAMFLVSYFYCKYKLSLKLISFRSTIEKKRSVRKEFFLFSWPLLFYSLVSLIFFWVDSFFIGYFLSPLEVGLYNAAVPLALLLSFTPELFIKLFFPLITRELSKKNDGAIRELSKQVQKWILLINIPFALLLVFFPEIFINFFFGSEYLASASSLQILALGGLIISFLWVPNSLILAKGKSKLILYNILFALGVNIILNILLIPLYGINGAAIGTVISKVILGGFLFFEVYKYYSFVPIRRKSFYFLISASISFICLLFLSRFVESNFFSIFLLVFFYILFYFLLILLMKALDKNDVFLLKEIRKRILPKSF